LYRWFGLKKRNNIFINIMTMMLLIVGGAIAVWLFGMGGMSQVQSMIGGLGGGSNDNTGDNVSVSPSTGVNVGGIHVGLDGIRVPGLVNIGGVTGNAGSGLVGVGNQTKVQRNINTTGAANQSSTINQSHKIIQQNGKTLFESNLGRMSYN
jgi:hypothetical protein